MSLRVLHHNNCFDGACSAAVFTRFHREQIGPAAGGYEYVGLQHGPVAGVPETVFAANENAIVDFKYSPSPRLTWWFDHHQSAFASEADRLHFERGQQGAAGETGAEAMRQFFNPEFVSCTSWIATVGRTRFGWNPTGLEELLKWADIIDGARFESARAAVEMEAPAMKVAMVIENAEPTGFIPRVIPLLTEMPMAEVLEQRFIAAKVDPLWEQHRKVMELIRQRAALEDGVVYFDLTDHGVEGLNKFIPYYFFPEATYTVALTCSTTRVKISVGTNPWTTKTAAELVNLSAVCERFGGGGHARVGAISLRAEEVERGRAIATGIVRELQASVLNV